jgi:phosphoribosylformylglycinamidine synthase subunit PurQ / glutaminase
MKFGILRFPGSCDEVDALHAARRVGDAELLWHGERDLKGADAIVVPGGFSYGDYLRAGAIARFSPVMESVVSFANEGGLVLGICNGFQVLCEARLLPGALLPNANLRFTFRQVELEVVAHDTAFTCACGSPGASERSDGGERSGAGEPLGVGGRSGVSHFTLSIPAKHSWGRYYADHHTLETLEENGQVVLRYAPGENFNGSLNDVAGVCNERGNVFGLMPHPEHAVDELTGSADGLCIFASMRLAVEGARV